MPILDLRTNDWNSPVPAHHSQRRFAYFLVIASFVVGIPARAENPFANLGPGTGGGGGVVVCLSRNHTVRSVALVDLVESKFYDKTIFSSKLAHLPWEEQVKAAVNRIAFADPQFHAMLWERVQTVRREFAHSMDETRQTDVIFPAPQDLSHGRVPPLRLGCQLAGVAVFSDGSQAGSRLKISHFLWKRLAPMHQAALILHESVYLTHRDIYRNLGRADSPDSSVTRALIGFLFSQELEKNSTTKQERERFVNSFSYRSYYLPLEEVDPRLSFRNRVQSLLKPLVPYFQKGVERPLFLDAKSCRDGNYILKIAEEDSSAGNPKESCEMSTIAYKGIGVSVVSPLSPTEQAGKGKSFSFRRYTNNLLEDIRLTCHSSIPLRRHNPGFRIYCGNAEIAYIESSDKQESTGLSIKNKWDFQNTFLRDFQFE